MELTLESAFSSDGLLGHFAYIILIFSMLMRTMFWLRVFVIISATLAVAYASIILNDPVSTFWETLLVLVNIAQLTIANWRNIRARFSDAETAFVARHFPTLSRGEARALLDLGTWRDLADGDVLATQGHPVSALSFLASGRAGVEVGGVHVAECGADDFVGEMTVLSAQPATATVRATGPLRVWQIAPDALRNLLERRDVFARELDAAIARNYREKLVQMNSMAASGAVPV
jgi:hypothetical protein